MAGRQGKVGLDYFELDCLLNDKIRLIQAEFGLKGFAVIVKLYQKIYGGNGYYCEWNEDILLLFLVENGLNSDSKNLINEIVQACIRRDIFSGPDGCPSGRPERQGLRFTLELPLAGGCLSTTVTA